MRALVVAVAAAYAWWAAGLRPFTWPVLAAVVVAGIAAVALGTRRRRVAGDDPDGAMVWAVLLALLAGWELAAYFQAPRADHPTLSSLANEVLDWRPARAVAFLVWAAVGVDLARR
ncbi:MAG TPA: hypothetical protein VHF27_01725 [Acidimicrobiales bacterium]|nr:hypothetical protein [Acidimicrobiales bacterium]